MATGMVSMATTRCGNLPSKETPTTVVAAAGIVVAPSPLVVAPGETVVVPVITAPAAAIGPAVVATATVVEAAVAAAIVVAGAGVCSCQASAKEDSLRGTEMPRHILSLSRATSINMLP